MSPGLLFVRVPQQQTESALKVRSRYGVLAAQTSDIEHVKAAGNDVELDHPMSARC